MCRINRCYRAIAAFFQRTIGIVAVFITLVGVPRGFNIIHLVSVAIHRYVKTHIIKEEKFRFWSEESLIRHAGGTHIIFRTKCDRTRIAIIALHGGRFKNATTEG